ncbi:MULTISPECIES: gamma-glutamyltransferase family protein [unclassified Ruegeria]|uniref:gamma-glutamyltransferase family protein n=1 Tax=unclassified Ruegeria TaxID=2625375 RepID=UPI001490ACD9|nr:MULTISPECIES: gamma-glutamyltransferase family protein [unclassified Ruegeria]NOD49170.1 gamma-glutamyltransferase [Ruegeria sp. HKCCD5849]NOD51734.1 gamma-glutamyltransferase [Ruegeria sp. HKCCD5851]NOD68720.1 gamma-glutamyltransferase [Ruegeria sp. HKCCD7303]
MRDLHKPGRSEVFATQGMCATSHPLAAKVAIDILERGGNAMDAAIAGAVLLGICEPQMTGLGGDCFVLFNRAGENRVRALNGSGRSPAGSQAQPLRDLGLSSVPLNGPDAVTIPGAVDAFCHLAEAEGRLGLEAILSPAIHYAEAGIPVAPRVAFDWKIGAATLQGAARDHYLIDGQAPDVGQVFRAPGQAEVLRRIAREGRDAFYSGAIAEDMIAAVSAQGGVHSADDFQNTQFTETQPMRGAYNGIELVEHPPNGQGATAILLLNILKHLDLANMDPFGAERVHIEAEATKLAYDARNRFIADPDHVSKAERFLDPDLAAKLAALIDPKRAMPSAAQLTEAVHKDTVYITVVDRDQMAVSLIYSIFHSFGSGIASEKYGILLQNRGAGFTLEPGHPNELSGGKRPMHTIIPGMLTENGRIMMPFGVMGGAYQPTGHARFVSNLRDFGLELQESINAPRAFFDGSVLKLERGYPEGVAKQLSEIGHTIERPETPLGGAQSIRIREDGILEGASDPRKDGCALGY